MSESLPSNRAFDATRRAIADDFGGVLELEIEEERLEALADGVGRREPSLDRKTYFRELLPWPWTDRVRCTRWCRSPLV